ncbi:YdeI/OmpD-associated family protein [Saxibacter everestensis]|uniref:YdeI/OmpD-associated family protein n=1 Tax=Saxibacter everestensis TaxID=2909229 RepID=A0ABY8QVQ5_9MICO|nr:YdeI/OmpD-associated family protein [Brevibacteriaceae bacterium ZFBP1038]
MAEKTLQRNASDPPAIGFEGHVQSIGDRTIVRFPDDASARLPSRGQVAVKAVLTVKAAPNGHAFDAVVEPDGMRGHWLEVGKKLLKALTLGDGDTVSIEVEPTKDWPEPDIPADFQAALADAPDITEEWKSITPMARWEWVRWINATKNAETRKRRVEVSISKLRSGKRRPCCFDLAACTDPDLSKSGKLVDTV